MKILFLSRRSDNNVGVFNYHGLEQEIANLTECVFAGLGWPLHRPNESVNDTIKRVMPDADWIICPREILVNANKIKHKTLIMITDLHGKWNWKLRNPKQFADTLDKAGYDLVLSRYKEVHNTGFDNKIFPQTLKNKFIWFPWSMDPEYYHCTRTKYAYDVVLLASIGLEAPHIYPLRVNMWMRLPGFCETNSYRYLRSKRLGIPVWKAKIDNLEAKGELVGKNYVRTLCKSRSTIFGNSKFRYPLQRNFESRLCGCLVLSDAPIGAKELGFKDGVDYVKVDKSNWAEKLRYYLNNWSKGKKIADQGRNLMLKRHTHKIRAKQFINILQRR